MPSPHFTNNLGRIVAITSIAALSLSGLAGCSGAASGSGSAEAGGTITYWASNQGSSVT